MQPLLLVNPLTVQHLPACSTRLLPSLLLSLLSPHVSSWCLIESGQVPPSHEVVASDDMHQKFLPKKDSVCYQKDFIASIFLPPLIIHALG